MKANKYEGLQKAVNRDCGYNWTVSGSNFNTDIYFSANIPFTKYWDGQIEDIWRDIGIISCKVGNMDNWIAIDADTYVDTEEGWEARYEAICEGKLVDGFKVLYDAEDLIKIWLWNVEDEAEEKGFEVSEDCMVTVFIKALN